MPSPSHRVTDHILDPSRSATLKTRNIIPLTVTMQSSSQHEITGTSHSYHRSLCTITIQLESKQAQPILQKESSFLRRKDKSYSFREESHSSVIFASHIDLDGRCVAVDTVHSRAQRRNTRLAHFAVQLPPVCQNYHTDQFIQ